VVREGPTSEALRHGESSLASLLDDDIVKVGPDTPVADLFAPAAETPVPLAVVDDDGKLLGVIPRVTLLAALGNGSEEPEPVDDPPADLDPTASVSADREGDADVSA
jgi:glycine betaine/proline transport system ATP-binding protein